MRSSYQDEKGVEVLSKAYGRDDPLSGHRMSDPRCSLRSAERCSFIVPDPAAILDECPESPRTCSENRRGLLCTDEDPTPVDRLGSKALHQAVEASQRVTVGRR